MGDDIIKADYKMAQGLMIINNHDIHYSHYTIHKYTVPNEVIGQTTNLL